MKTACVIPCYNLGQYLKQSVSSALNQVRPFDRILVVDDGSTQEDIEDRLAEVESMGVEVLRIRNQGYARARNIGGRFCKGSDILVFLDADDWLFNTYNLRVVNYFLDDEVGVVCPEVIADGVTVAGGTWPAPQDDSLARLCASNYVWAASAVRTKAFLDVNGFRREMEPAADWAFWVAIRLAGWRIKGHHEPLWHWRDRPDGLHMLIDPNVTRGRMFEAFPELYGSHASV